MGQINLVFKVWEKKKIKECGMWTPGRKERFMSSFTHHFFLSSNAKSVALDY